MRIPEKGLDKDEIFKQMTVFREEDLDWRSGRVMGYIYDAGKEAEEIGKKAYMMYLTENGLDPTAFPSLARFENELVSMVADHVGGDKDVVGNFTSGGTESILMAVKTARDYFRVRRPGIVMPEMILPTTAHAAFHKASVYFDVRVMPVPVNSETYKADVEAVKRAITENTILLVGSAPSYAHGVIDPIYEMGQIALEHDILFHTDACVGGLMLPYLKQLGEPVPDFGFDIPGVTSVSVDLHKYGYTPKNASLILYRNKSIRKHQIFACAGWPGYTVVNSAFQSSKTGGSLAASWAVMNFIGHNGYLEIARKTLEATHKLVQGIAEIEDLRVMVKPEMVMFAVTSDTVNVFHIIDEMKERGWYIQPQLEFQNSQKNFHISVNVSSVDLVDDLLNALRDSVEAARSLKTGELVTTIKDALANMGPNDINDDNISDMMAMAGLDGGDLPERMADINEIMNTLTVNQRELMLKAFLNDLFSQKKPG
ncbi:MAG: aspartate aminotransferase family protein [Deltaproteobacteria bacterium]|nr:aspartate aminotransferase family protein [Deltaproteobacteria bacterium]